MELFRIPKDLMTVEGKEDPAQVINRFKWLTTETFLIVSKEGVEKLVHIDDGFKEINYNYRPLFTDISGVEYTNSHYYVLRSKLTESQVIERLKRRYQTYKTSYFLFGIRDNQTLY